jgi:phage terminase large subunit-like protein
MADNNDDIDNPITKTAQEPETFSKDYVRELRHENAGYRLKAQEMERKAQEAAESAKKAQDEAIAKAQEAEQQAAQRIIKAEMKAHAIKAGIVDIDALALADLSGVKFNDAGEIEGADAAIDALKKSKPYLFAQTTSSTQQPPKGGKQETKTARDLSDAELRSELKSKFGIRV